MEKTKEERIKLEERKIKRVLSDLDKNKLQIITPLIKTAAFMAVSLPELEAIINASGYTFESQYGAKPSEDVKLHLAMTKNLALVLKTLADIVPEKRGRKSRLDELRET